MLTAKIVPLRKANKEDYTKAKAYSQISLLPTLSKALEAVIAERLSYYVETHNLLPQSHYGARKQSSTTQALTTIQERILTAWRERKTLSLVTFDIKERIMGWRKGHCLQSCAVADFLNAWCDGWKPSAATERHSSQSMDSTQRSPRSSMLICRKALLLRLFSTLQRGPSARTALKTRRGSRIRGRLHNVGSR